MMQKGFVALLLGSVLVTGALTHGVQAESAPPAEFKTQAFDGISSNLTPESTVQWLVYQFNHNMLYTNQASSMIVGGQIDDDPYSMEIVQEIEKSRGTMTLANSRPTFKVRGDEAIATYQLTMQSPLFPSSTRTETLTLQKSNKARDAQNPWKIVPGDVKTIFDDPQSGYLLRLATYLAKPYDSLQKIRAARSAENAKALALAISAVSQENEENLKLTKDGWLQAIIPYIDFKMAFLGEDGMRTISYFSLNENLAGMTGMEIAKTIDASTVKRSQVVLLYDGSDQKLRFSSDGKSPVAFADYHVELVTPAQAKTLVWKLKK